MRVSLETSDEHVHMILSTNLMIKIPWILPLVRGIVSLLVIVFAMGW